MAELFKNQIRDKNNEIQLLKEQIGNLTKAHNDLLCEFGKLQDIVKFSKNDVIHSSNSKRLADVEISPIGETKSAKRTAESSANSSMNVDTETAEFIPINNNQGTSQHNLTLNRMDVGDTFQSMNTAAEGKLKHTPIQLAKYQPEQLREIHDQLRIKFGAIFHWSHQNRFSSVRIYAMTDPYKALIMNHLRAKQIEFNSYTTKLNRKKSYIIRGLPFENDDATCQLITDTLTEHGIYPIVTVQRFNTPGIKRNPKTSQSLFQVIFEFDADTSNLGSIKTMGTYRVKIEQQSRSKVMQCKNCQRFQHTASQCNFQYRCVQCITKHQQGICPRKMNKKLPLGCVNCHEAKLDHAGHTANNLQECSFLNTKITKNSPGFTR